MASQVPHPILGSQPNLLGCRCDPARKVTCASPEQSLRCIRGWRRWRGRRLTTPGPDSQRASPLSGPPPPEGSGVRLCFPHPAHPQRPEGQTWIPLSSSRGLRPRSSAPAGKSRPTCRLWLRPSSERVSPDFRLAPRDSPAANKRRLLEGEAPPGRSGLFPPSPRTAEETANREIQRSGFGWICNPVPPSLSDRPSQKAIISLQNWTSSF